MPSNKQLSISCSECQNADIAPRDFQGFLRNFQNLIGAIYIVFLAPFRHLVNSLIFTQVQDRRTLPGHRGYLGLGAASQTVDAYFKTVLILNGLRGWEHLFWRQSLRVPAVPLGSGIAQPRHNTTQHPLAKEWNQQDGRFFWPSCGKFVFRGTRTHLQNSYFIVSVLTGQPPAFLANNALLGCRKPL